jgi:histidine triad (HIT) family protein
MATQEKFMYHHAPPDYVCPFCLLIQGKESMESPLKLTDIVFQNADVTAFIATRKYPNNQGHVLIIPNGHYENIYDLPLDLSLKIQTSSKDIASAMKSEYQCDGILLQQHNEPAGDQHIWHYHLHVIPRYHGDDFHNAQKLPFEAAERAKYAQRLRNWFRRQKEHLVEETESDKS